MNIKKLCRVATLATIMVVAKELLSFIPNGELVTSITVCGTLIFGWEMLLTTVVFSLLEILIYGFGLWTIMYLYIWNILVIVVMLLKPIVRYNRVIWSLIMGLYGLLFGTLCSIPYWFIGGPGTAIAWIASGLPFDFLHCAMNTVIGFVVFNVLINIFKRGRRLTENV